MRRTVCLILLLLCCLPILAGCGGRAPEAAPEPSPVPEESAAPEPTPDPLRDRDGMLLFPDGSRYHGYEVQIALPGLQSTDFDACEALFAAMPNLHTVDLGEKTPERRLSLESLEKLQKRFPALDFLYRFTVWGKEVSTADTALDLKYIQMNDEGDQVVRALRCMPHCRYLDMDSCRVSSEAMGRIRDAFPQVEVVWRIWFGKEFSVRTDVTRIIAGNHLTDRDGEELKYCTKVRLLDVGHNPNLTDISFLENMPDLEVLILAIMPFRDLTPLTNCTKLEYLELCEMQQHPGKVLDLSPLAGMTGLHHLNICKLWEVENYEFLETFTELERLWIGCYTYIPKDYIDHLKEVLPNTVINSWTQVCVTEKWREDPPGIFVPRYEYLRIQFDYWHFDRSTSYWWNDPLCQGNIDKVYEEKP